MTAEEFRQMALSFPFTEENPHFERQAFKVTGRRIFATLHEPSNTANLKLSEVDQSVFCEFNKNEGAIYPVPNKWGLQGWTTFELTKVPHGLMQDALQTAYSSAAQPKNRKK